MLICNLIEERYRLIKNKQFGKTCNFDTLYVMFIEDQKMSTDCLAYSNCYTAILCTNPTTNSCGLSITGGNTILACDTLTVTLTQL